jgi:hypothetical protein
MFAILALAALSAHVCSPPPAYDNFIADAGTYEYTDTTLTVRNIIAKVPNVMPPYASGPVTYHWRLDGEALVLTLRSAWAPADGEITYTLSRRE